MIKNDYPTNPKFLGCLSSSQTHTLYSIVLLTISLITLSNLPKSSSILFEHESGGGGELEEEEDDLINSRTVLELSIVFLKVLAQSAFVSSLISLTGTILARARLQIPIKSQAIVNLFISSFGSVVLGTLYISPNLMTSATHELCLFALRSDSLSSLSRTPDYYNWLPSTMSSQSFAYFWPTSSTIVGENCDERASSIVLPTLLLLCLCNLFHLHLLYVLFYSSTPSPTSSSLLPIHLPSTKNLDNSNQSHPTLEKNLIIL